MPVLDQLKTRSSELWAAVVAGIRNGRKISRGEGMVMHQGGRIFPIGLSTTTFRQEAQEAPSVTAIFTDISDLKEVQELQARAERLEAVAALSASLAHEIRNPLASIRSSVEQLARSKHADDDERFLAGLIVRESDRLSRLLSEFLDFARVRATHFVPLDLHAVVVAVVRLIRAHPDCRPDAAITVEGGRTMLDGDEDLLHRVIANLVLNAVQAARGPIRITVSVAAVQGPEIPHGTNLDHAVRLQVRDDGPGIPAGNPGAAVRAVRLRAAGRQRARPRHRAAGRRGAPGPGAGGLRARGGHDLHYLSARQDDGGGCRMSHKPSVLVVDDESGILDTLRILLRNEGFEVHHRAGRQGRAWSRSARAPTTSSSPTCGCRRCRGLDILNAAREQDPMTPVILMTAQASLQSAIGAVNSGAFYYIQKPFCNDELVAILRRACEFRRCGSRTSSSSRRSAAATRPPSPGRSASRSGSSRCSSSPSTWRPTDSTVLIQGESGTGKEVVARYVHNLSNRTDGPFLSINCGALPENLLESELFGHVKGSFTGAVRDKQGLFAAARGGSFFLDEVGEMPPSLQVKLLRVLQEREAIPVGATEAIPVDVRIIAATNRDLEEEIRRGNFRSDLFYRLNVIALNLPPLRDRRDDLLLLIESFLQQLARAKPAASPRRWRPRRSMRSWCTSGPATCASWRTPWSTPPC